MEKATFAPESDGFGEPPFIDRVEQLWWLERCLRDALSGQPRLVLLEGEAGIGKTRLVREFGWLARQLGAEVLVGRAHEGLGLPYLSMAEAYRPHLEAHAGSLPPEVVEPLRRLCLGDLGSSEPRGRAPPVPSAGPKPAA